MVEKPVFANNDHALLERADKARAERRKAGLEGLVGGLEAVIVNTGPGGYADAAREMLRHTGHDIACAFEDEGAATLVLARPGSADFLLRSPKGPDPANPFRPYNTGPKSAHQPDARLETFIYACQDLERYTALQQERGVRFLTAAPLRTEHYAFIQTPPSPYTGNSTGFLQWLGARRDYRPARAKDADPGPAKPALPHLAAIGRLDHTATRVRAEERDDAIIEFMGLTGYDFAFAVYVETLNSITNVARLAEGEYAQVFTSGIKPFTTFENSGPTERFIYNYGLRVHHLAFETRDIESTYRALVNDGLGFLVELVGGPDEGLHQTFSQMSPHTFLVNEYIWRYGDFDGFFTKSNVTQLTLATDKQ